MDEVGVKMVKNYLELWLAGSDSRMYERF